MAQITYKTSMEDGRDLKRLIGILRNPTVKAVTRIAVEKLAPDELETFDYTHERLIREIGRVARENGNEGVASYIDSLLEESKSDP